MRITCKSTKRYLCNIKIEEYNNELKKMGIEATIPLEIELYCPRCKKTEVYLIYPNTYTFKESYSIKNNLKK